MTQKLKEKIDETFRYVAERANSSSIADLRSNVSEAIAGAKNAAAEHIDEFERLNSKVDPVADEFLQKAKDSKFSFLYIAFLFVTGMAVGFGICSAIQ